MACICWIRSVPTGWERRLIILPPFVCGIRIREQIPLLATERSHAGQVGWKEGKKPVSKLDTMGKAVLHHGANTAVCTFIAWLCACDCAAINGVQVRARALRPAGSGNQTKHMIECFVLWQPAFAICHWKEARLIACTSRLARSTRRLKCEVSVGAREGVRWCVCLGRCGASSARYSSTAVVPAVIQEPLEAGWVMRRNSFH